MGSHVHTRLPWNPRDLDNLAVEWHADGNRILVVTQYCPCGDTWKTYVRLEEHGD